jgi:hypothetical protein
MIFLNNFKTIGKLAWYLAGAPGAFCVERIPEGKEVNKSKPVCQGAYSFLVKYGQPGLSANILRPCDIPVGRGFNGGELRFISVAETMARWNYNISGPVPHRVRLWHFGPGRYHAGLLLWVPFSVK